MSRHKGERRGPRYTLVAPPHLQRIREALHDKGYKSIRHAAFSVGFGESQLSKILRDGISGDSHIGTVERLRRLGILELVPKKDSA